MSDKRFYIYIRRCQWVLSVSIKKISFYRYNLPNLLWKEQKLYIIVKHEESRLVNGHRTVAHFEWGQVVFVSRSQQIFHTVKVTPFKKFLGCYFDSCPNFWHVTDDITDIIEHVCFETRKKNPLTSDYFSLI